ncbi:Filament-like plant protein 6 [Forsythia ovata]|uniref:Filament-like plant protein 6 n=1 Tax=Forsythia ovata TaxID=205694 RepID=A0ABD1QEC2_9LAMI
MSEDGNDDAVSCAGSWATSLMSELSHFKKEKNVNGLQKSKNANNLCLMDDFLEMEKLAYNDSCEAVSTSDTSVNGGNAKPDIVNHETSTEVTMGTDSHSREHRDSEAQVQTDLPILMKLKSRISMVFESMSEEKDIEKVLQDIRCVVQEIHDTLHHQSANRVAEAQLAN